jgi:hypothetical protein
MGYKIKTETMMVPDHPDDGPTIKMLDDGSMTFKWGDDLMFTMRKDDVNRLADYLRHRSYARSLITSHLDPKFKPSTCYATEA